MKTHKQIITDYLPKVKDPMAVSMLQCLLNDVKQLEEQLGQQKERMDSFHTNLQRYSDNVIRKIVQTGQTC